LEVSGVRNAYEARLRASPWSAGASQRRSDYLSKLAL